MAVEKSKKQTLKGNDRLTCRVCGLIVVVDEICGCIATCDVICCEKQMTKVKATKKTAKKAVKKQAPKKAKAETSKKK